MTEEIDLFPIQQAPKPREQTTRSLMQFASEKGWPLKRLANEKIMGLSVRTLQKYARRFELRFADYVPYKLRSAEERRHK